MIIGIHPLLLQSIVEQQAKQLSSIQDQIGNENRNTLNGEARKPHSPNQSPSKGSTRPKSKGIQKEKSSRAQKALLLGEGGMAWRVDDSGKPEWGSGAAPLIWKDDLKYLNGDARELK